MKPWRAWYVREIYCSHLRIVASEDLEGAWRAWQECACLAPATSSRRHNGFSCQDLALVKIWCDFQELTDVKTSLPTNLPVQSGEIYQLGNIFHTPPCFPPLSAEHPNKMCWRNGKVPKPPFVVRPGNRPSKGIPGTIPSVDSNSVKLLLVYKTIIWL